MSEISQSELKEILDYDPETGDLIWARSGCGIKKGKIAGSAHGGGTLQ